MLIKGKQRKSNFDNTILGEKVTTTRSSHEKMIEHHFSKNNNSTIHIQGKEEEIINMVALLGLTIENGIMSRAYVKTMIILEKKCMIPKLPRGMEAFAITKKEEEMVEIKARKIFRNFGNLLQGTPKIALLNYSGIWPLIYEITKQTLMTWHRINVKQQNNKGSCQWTNKRGPTAVFTNISNCQWYENWYPRGKAYHQTEIEDSIKENLKKKKLFERRLRRARDMAKS